MKILIIDDDTALCRSLQIHLEREDYTVETAHTCAEGKELIQESSPDMVFLDVQLPDANGLDLLRDLRNNSVEVPIVMITGIQDTHATIDAVQLGVVDYIRKPLDLDDVILTVQKVSAQVSQNSYNVNGFDDANWRRNEIIGIEPKTVEVIKQIGILSENRTSVLIQGESGTGKELVAKVLHEATDPSQPFVAINCSAIVPTLLESELFGHEKGSFTGATEKKLGKMELADRGTLFLDEIGEMSLDLQAKILRALEERQFERVGGTKTRSLEARIIAATNKDLREMVDTGSFREDLYYRLVVSTIFVPPLRKRLRDIPLLINYILYQVSKDIKKEARGVEEKAIQRLQEHTWPGNVRELRNTLMRALIRTRNGVITENIVCQCIDEPMNHIHEDSDATRTLSVVETEYIQRVLDATGWNISHAAEILGITRVTLRSKIEARKLTPPEHMRPGTKRRNSELA